MTAGWTGECPALPSVAVMASPVRHRTLSEGSVVRLEDINRAPSRVTTHSHTRRMPTIVKSTALDVASQGIGHSNHYTTCH